MSDTGRTALIRVELHPERLIWGRLRTGVTLPNGTRVWVETQALEAAIVEPTADAELDAAVIALAGDPQVAALPPGAIALILRLLWPLIERLLSRIDRKRKEWSQ